MIEYNLKKAFGFLDAIIKNPDKLSKLKSGTHIKFMQPYEEFKIVKLTQDLPGTPFKKGKEGVIVMVYNNGEAYEVEFFDSKGKTIGLETVKTEHLKLKNT